MFLSIVVLLFDHGGRKKIGQVAKLCADGVRSAIEEAKNVPFGHEAW
jgi:hypothetical protein